MTIYSFENNSFQNIEQTTFDSEGLLERKHLQSAIKQKLDVIAPDCLIISEEFAEWTGSQRRIDLLAIDKKGNLVIIELKRTETGNHMELQALRYAAMISTLTYSRAIEIYQKYLKSIGSEANAETNIIEFLDWEESQEELFGLQVRIILVSENFSKELTTSVMWLNEKNLDIRCIRLIPYKNQEEILIDVQQIIPLPEAESYQIKLKEQSDERRKAKNSPKDNTQYKFQEGIYNKRKLVLAVIQYWISKNQPSNLSELLETFPQETRPGGRMFVTEEEAIEISLKGQSRYFLGEDVIEFPDSTRYAISNQWGKGNIQEFFNISEKIGYLIESEKN
jgi:hypothetical protein